MFPSFLSSVPSSHEYSFPFTLHYIVIISRSEMKEKSEIIACRREVPTCEADIYNILL